MRAGHLSAASSLSVTIARERSGGTRENCDRGMNGRGMNGCCTKKILLASTMVANTRPPGKSRDLMRAGHDPPTVVSSQVRRNRLIPVEQQGRTIRAKTRVIAYDENHGAAKEGFQFFA